MEAMFNLGQVGPNDLLYDLGSGDGRILIAAARERNTRGIGIEIDPMRISDAMEEAAHFRVEYMVDFIEDDIFTADFKDATVVTLYLLESINIQLRPRLLNELRPGSRIISHAFDMGDWQADEHLELGGVNLYKWIIPAQVAGVWEWDDLNDQRYRVELHQKYQEITGQAWLAEQTVDLVSATLCGNKLTLQIQGKKPASLKTFTLVFDKNELQTIEEET